MNLWNSLRFLYAQIFVFTLSLNFSASYLTTLPTPVAARSKAWDCGRWLDGIAGSNHAELMDVCLLWLLCFVRQRSLRRADPSSRAVLPSDMCLECDFETSTVERRSPTKVVESWKKNYTARRFGWLPCEQCDRYRHIDLLCRQQKVFCVRIFHGEQYRTWFE